MAREIELETGQREEADRLRQVEEHRYDRADRKRPFEAEGDVDEHRDGGQPQGHEAVLQQLLADGRTHHLHAPDLAAMQSRLDRTPRLGGHRRFIAAGGRWLLEAEQHIIRPAELLDLHLP